MTKRAFGDRLLELVHADITTLEADAIVNAANAALAGGGGVDGAIHRAGGPSIMAECRRIGGCPTGSAAITGAGALRARHVIHAVAPIYRGHRSDPELLRAAYLASLELASRHGLEHVAFPSLGTGAYAYPIAAAAAIALRTVREHLAGETSLRRVTFALFSAGDLAAYAAALEALPG
ncbi:MAG TPA: macro domain-containing protein [Verrucomicrobiae bacterium]|nr:macro domain-containing protein [Verrucomicrobiae bacterium]